MYYFTIRNNHNGISAMSSLKTEDLYWTRKGCERAGMAELHRLELKAPADRPYKLEICESPVDKEHWDQIQNLMDLGL